MPAKNPAPKPPTFTAAQRKTLEPLIMRASLTSARWSTAHASHVKARTNAAASKGGQWISTYDALQKREASALEAGAALAKALRGLR